MGERSVSGGRISRKAIPGATQSTCVERIDTYGVTSFANAVRSIGGKADDDVGLVAAPGSATRSPVGPDIVSPVNAEAGCPSVVADAAGIVAALGAGRSIGHV